MEKTQSKLSQKHGYIVFEKPIVLQEVPQIMAKGYKQTLTIDWGDYERQGWKNRSSSIKEIKANKLSLRNNRYLNLLQEIRHISFPQLTIIDLSSNHINSIQILPQLSIPYLKQLNLNHNFIISSRPLVKSFFPNLETIRIQQNPLYDNTRIFEAQFPKLKEYQLDSNEKHQHRYGQRQWSDPIVWRIKNAPALQKQTQIKRYPPRCLQYDFEDQNPLTLKCTKYSEMLAKKPVYYRQKE